MKSSLLLEGGVAGHLSHLHDNRTLTLPKIKKILSAASGGELVGTEKTDGFNIYLGFVNGEARSARNKTHMRQGGINAKELAMREFKGGEKVRKAYMDSFDAYEAAVKSLNPAEVKAIFGENGEVFYNTEIMGPGASNVLNYDANVLAIHRGGHKMYDRASDKVMDVDAEKNSIILDNVINKFEMATSEKNFTVQRTATMKLRALEGDADVRIAIAKMERAGLRGNMTIEDYLEAKIKNEIDTELNYLDAQTRQDIIDKMLKRDGAKNLRDIYKNYPVDQKDIIRKYVKKGPELISKAIFPIEDAIHDFAVEMLRGLESAYILDNSKELERLRREINSAISEIKDYTGPGEDEAKSVLAKQLQKIKHHDNISTTVEGFVFQSPLPNERGQLYKFTGNYAPINQILGLFRYGRGSAPAIKRSSDGAEPLQEAEGGKTVAVVPGAFKPPHNGHLDMIKHYADIADEVIVYVSPLDRGGVTAEQSMAIWEIYKKAAGLNNVQVRKSENNSPVRASIDYVAEGGPAGYGEKVILGVSTKGGDEERFAGNVRKYADPQKDLEIKVIPFEPMGEQLSASDFRAAIKSAEQAVDKFLPREVIANKMIVDVMSVLGKGQKEQPLDADTLFEMINLIMNERQLLKEAELTPMGDSKDIENKNKLANKSLKLQLKQFAVDKKAQKIQQKQLKLRKKQSKLEKDIAQDAEKFAKEKEAEETDSPDATPDVGSGKEVSDAVSQAVASDDVAEKAVQDITASAEEEMRSAADERAAEEAEAAEEEAESEEKEKEDKKKEFDDELASRSDAAAEEHSERMKDMQTKDAEFRQDAYDKAQADLEEVSAGGAGAVAGYAGKRKTDDEEESLIREHTEVMINKILEELINSQFVR